MRYDFASDTASGLCPEASTSLHEANHGAAPAYGEDAWTQDAADRIRGVFETDCAVFFVLSGTAANALALAATCRSYQSVICHDQAHVERDECGAPEFFTGGAKVELTSGPHGKLDPASVAHRINGRRFPHSPRPGAISITQSTELGTIYQPTEIAALSAIARSHAMALHMDGARFANAVAGTGLPPRALSWEAGVDVLSFGGTKNGLAIGEAVVIFRPDLAADFDHRVKQGGHLCAKMRFVSAPWVGVLRDGAWLRHAAHANAMARRLAAGVATLPGVRLLFPTEANSVLAAMPQSLVAALHARGWEFYKFWGDDGHRLVCSWQTTVAAVDEFLTDARRCLA